MLCKTWTKPLCNFFQFFIVQKNCAIFCEKKCNTGNVGNTKILLHNFVYIAQFCEQYWDVLVCRCSLKTYVEDIFTDVRWTHPSKISALSKSDTKLYVLLRANQPKFYCWKHSTMVENSIETTWIACLKRFSTSPGMRKTLKFRNKLLAKFNHNMIVSKWLVDEELAKISFLHFELISTILESKHCEDENSHQNRDSFVSSRESDFF